MNRNAATLDGEPGALTAGTLLDGRYRLLSRIGSGGMGEVWSALHEALARTVAVKVVAGIAPEMRDRLRAEAQALARLSHPAVVSVFDAGQLADGRPFLVLELVEGETLEDRLERDGPMTPAAAARLLAPVASALAAAHGVSVVHRDVKPSNILLMRTPEGEPLAKLADFGIAASSDPLASRMTVTGGLVGTPAYMAPEQLRSQRADGRADVWGLSVTLYEVLTGSLPFTDDTITGLILKVMQDEPHWAPLDAIDVDLAQIVKRGMAKDLAGRFASASELAGALEAWLARAAVAPAARHLTPASPPATGQLDALIRSKFS